ncbi:MAG: response regulator [Myxococcaceae bacterium]|nr:response regulator [Myxococcaceae bacterium]
MQDTETTSSTETLRNDDELQRQQVRRTVLLVEDDPANRESLGEILQLWGYEVLPVSSAEEAEYAVRRRQPDVALIDVYLPGKSGASLMTRLRDRFPDVVLIGMSGLGDSAMARTVKGVGADIFIGKPIDLDALARALKASHTSWH